MLENLEPKKVFSFFEEITKIPHCSYKEEQISKYLYEFAKKRNLYAHRDKFNNILIKKKATNNKQNQKPVILQGHMDMVCVKKDGFDFDFETQPLPLVIDGDWLKTEGTTLGADNGIAVAMILEILDGDYIHPDLECLITTEEEVGLNGAQNVDGSLFEGKTLINIDTEEEGVFCVSCSGGSRSDMIIDYKKEKNNKENSYKLNIKNLLGGHSGMEIDTQRANAIKLIADIMINFKEEFNIFSIKGGDATNAIAKSSEIIFSTNENITSIVAKQTQNIKEKFYKSDKDIEITLEKIDNVKEVLKEKESKKIIETIFLMKQGVVRMSDSIEGLVETSTNVGTIETTDENIIIHLSHRSSSEYQAEKMLMHDKIISKNLNIKTEGGSSYPGWQYEPNSEIRDLFIETYKEMYNKEPVVTAIHAGLECGILQNRIGKLDMISLGPDMKDVHSPNEKLNIPSVKRVFEFLLEILKKI